MMLHVQANMRRFDLVANYTLSKAQTWGCVLGELFDYVDGVCQCMADPTPDSLMRSAPAITAPLGKTFAIASSSPARSMFRAASN